MKTKALKRLRATLANDEPVYGLWVTLESASITEMAVALGMDWVVIDAEHGYLDWNFTSRSYADRRVTISVDARVPLGALSVRHPDLDYFLPGLLGVSGCPQPAHIVASGETLWLHIGHGMRFGLIDDRLPDRAMRRAATTTSAKITRTANSAMIAMMIHDGAKCVSAACARTGPLMVKLFM